MTQLDSTRPMQRKEARCYANTGAPNLMPTIFDGFLLLVGAERVPLRIHEEHEGPGLPLRRGRYGPSGMDHAIQSTPPASDVRSRGGAVCREDA